MSKKRKQVWAVVLSTALIAAQLSAVTIAETAAPEDGSIASFAALDKSMKKQEVPVGTKLFNLDLPDTLEARIYSVTSDVTDAEQEHEKAPEKENPPASPAEADKERVTTDSSGTGSTKISTKFTSYNEEIPVTWDSSPVYNGDAIGNYVFTADVGSYILSDGVKLPQITVTVVGNETTTQVLVGKNISDWSFVDDDNLNEGVLPLSRVSIDNQADFDTVVSMLPTQILAEIDDRESTAAGQEEPNGETVDIIGWNCPEYQEDGQGNWPVSGEYTFTARLESGYRCNPLPSVKVLLGGASLFTINDRFEVDGFLYKELGPDTVQLIGYKGDEPEGELHIPSQVVKPENGRPYEVVSIGSEAFAFCDKLTGSLVIPDTVTKIGAAAFTMCSFDGALVLPGGLTEIGASAFMMCSFTGTLKLPDSLTEIGSRAFRDCTGFTGPLVIPKQITVIRDNTFTSCIGFESLELPEGLTEIQSYALNGLNGIADKAITLPSTLTLIGIRSFGWYNNVEFKCPNLTIADLLYNSNRDLASAQITVNGVILPQLKPDKFYSFVADDIYYRITPGTNTVTAVSQQIQTGMLDIPREVTDAGTGQTYVVTAIGEDAFALLPITGVRIPDTVTEIRSGAFSTCLSLSGTLELPPGLTSIGDNAFSECQSLTGPLVIPDTVTEIGSNAFTNCFALESLTLPPGLTEISDSAFALCSNLSGSLNLPPALTRIGNSAFAYCSNLSGSLNLPSGLTHIGEQAFFGCIGLKGGAFLDKNITSIGWQAFDSSFPLTTNSPQVQLLINEYNNRKNLVDTFWDGGEDIPDGALVTVNQDVTLEQDRRVGREAESTIQKDSVMTVNKLFTVDGRLVVQGTLIINGTLTGSGTLYIARGGKVIGDISGIKVEYEPAPSSGGGGRGDGSYTNPDILRGTWIQTDTGIWMFRLTDGGYAKNRWGLAGGLWYYFNTEGHMLTGWQQLNGVWYYLHTAKDAGSTAGLQAGIKEGSMKTGWHFDSLYQQWFYFNINGAMADGWREINGKWYYFGSENNGTRGTMYADRITPDGYYVDKNGVCDWQSREEPSA